MCVRRIRNRRILSEVHHTVRQPNQQPASQPAYLFSAPDLLVEGERESVY